MTRTDMRLFLTALLLLTVAGLGALFLYWIGIDALEGHNHFQFFADSETYHAVARGDFSSLQGVGDFISIAGNFLGPVMLVKLVGDNYYIMMLLNVALLFFSVATIAKSLKLDVLAFTVLLLINPLTISSVLSVNKEMISVVFLALFMRAYTARSAAAFVGALLVSILVRWQLSLFLLVFAAIASPLNPFRRHRVATLVTMLLGMSVVYIELSFAFESVLDNALQSADEYQGSGLVDALTAVQQHGGYFLVFPLKAAHLLFGMGLRFDRLIAPRDIYNDTFQLIHSTMTLAVFIALLRKRKFHLRNDLIYISIIYMAIFTLSPIYSPRYFYLVYVLWVAALVARPPGVQFPGLNPRRVRNRFEPQGSAGAAAADGSKLPQVGAGAWPSLDSRAP